VAAAVHPPGIINHNDHFSTLIQLTSLDMPEREQTRMRQKGKVWKFIVIGNLIKHAAINVD
jgi:hypothetical protein